MYNSRYFIIVWEQACFSIQGDSCPYTSGEGYSRLQNYSLAISLLKRIIRYTAVRQIELEEAIKFVPYARVLLAHIYFQMGNREDAVRESWKGIQFFKRKSLYNLRNFIHGGVTSINKKARQSKTRE